MGLIAGIISYETTRVLYQIKEQCCLLFSIALFAWKETVLEAREEFSIRANTIEKLFLAQLNRACIFSIYV